jgi:hypothetical protein
MSDASKNWITVTESRYPWERDALDFVRDRWPDHDPYRAWANFEFIALDGSINEVDLLLLTPMGLFLFEVKSRPGRVFGDPGTWTWDTWGTDLRAASVSCYRARVPAWEVDMEQLTGQQIAETLVHLLYRFRGHLSRLEQDALEEGARRVRQHERLVADVVPDLRSRLTAAQDELRRRGP